MLATTIHKSNTTPHHQSGATTKPPRSKATPPPVPQPTGRRGDGLVVSKPNSVSDEFPADPKPRRGRARLLLHRQPHPLQAQRHLRSPNREPLTHVRHGGNLVVLLRKEVIQPHLPVRLPCYDFVPIADPTFDGSLPHGVRPPASGVTDFHDVTGGVYKARERIHRSVADLRLLATPTSRGRVADPDPN